MSFKSLPHFYPGGVAGAMSSHYAPLGSSFVPSDISGLQVWLDAELGVTKDGSNKVSAWLDQSSNAYNYTQALSAEQPTWVDASLNGKPIIRFSGVDQRLYMAVSNLVSNAAARTVISVFKPTAIGFLRCVLSFCGPSASQSYTLVLSDNASYNKVQVPQARSETDPATLNNTWHYFYSTYNGSGIATLSNHAMDFNRVAASLTAYNDMSAYERSNTIGHYQDTEAFGGAFQGDIAAVFLWNKVLSAGEKSQMNDYILERFAL